MEAQREELQPFEFTHHPAVRIVLGHVAFLLGQSCGPTEGTVADWRDWMNTDSAECDELAREIAAETVNA
jgi:hypothetical protein